MLEARLSQAAVLKKILDALRDLVTETNFDCNDSGISLEAMDNSHVSLVSLLLREDSFENYRCDRTVSLGINLKSLSTVLRCALNEDVITINAEDNPNVLNLVFESTTADRISEYDIKLMDIDQERLHIPETEYEATVTMPSAELQRIIRDLSPLSESVKIKINKSGAEFSCEGDIANGSVSVKQSTNTENEELSTVIQLVQPVALTFSLKYLNMFTKATPLSNQVTLNLGSELPLSVEYKMQGGHLRYYLAPKIGDEVDADDAARDNGDIEVE